MPSHLLFERYIARCSFILPLLAFLSFSAHLKKEPEQKRVTICLTYDDGLETQLSVVIPQLDSIGFKATFFLNSISGSAKSDHIGVTPEAVLGWTKAAIHGHELANHTLFHACPSKLGWDSAVAIERYTIDRMVEEISTENAMLSLLDPQRKSRSFAFPCGNFLINGEDYSKIIKDKGLVTFGRIAGDSNSVIRDFKTLNRMRVPAWQVETGTTLEQLISFAIKIKKAGGMGVYCFHGVGAQIFKVDTETHMAFLKYLKLHSEEYWVTTFSAAMEKLGKK